MAAVCGSSGIASLFSQAAFAAESDIADGKIVRFDFAGLQSMAQALAKSPGVARRDPCRIRSPI